jgi:predicted nuclease of predicted toxin-antitoxin system
VNFLVDAQLPLRLAQFLTRAGHDVLHTSELPNGNHSEDREIAQRADADNRVLITKDRDFRDGHLLMRSPRRLLVIATGNVTNDALMSLFQHHLDAITSAFDETHYVELTHDALALGQNP